MFSLLFNDSIHFNNSKYFICLIWRQLKVTKMMMRCNVTNMKIMSYHILITCLIVYLIILQTLILVTTITLYIFILGTNKKDKINNQNNVKGVCVCVFFFLKVALLMFFLVLVFDWRFNRKYNWYLIEGLMCLLQVLSRR